MAEAEEAGASGGAREETGDWEVLEGSQPRGVIPHPKIRGFRLLESFPRTGSMRIIKADGSCAESLSVVALASGYPSSVSRLRLMTGILIIGLVSGKGGRNPEQPVTQYQYLVLPTAASRDNLPGCEGFYQVPPFLHR